MRELRNQGQESEPQPSAPVTKPGDSLQQKNDGGGLRVDPPQQSVQPQMDFDFVEASLRPIPRGSDFRLVQTMRASERGKVWTAQIIQA
jgi:hypothetical protein